MLAATKISTQKSASQSRIKVGFILFGCTPIYDKERDKVSIDIDEWHVRSIRKRRGSETRIGCIVSPTLVDNSLYVNMTLKNEFTWVKKSKKTGDYGWASSIYPEWRKQFPITEPLPTGIFTTPLQALKYVLKNEEDSRQWYAKQLGVAKAQKDSELTGDLEGELRVIERTLKAVKSRIKKSRK